jgi:hypothetical protein
MYWGVHPHRPLSPSIQLALINRHEQTLLPLIMNHATSPSTRKFIHMDLLLELPEGLLLLLQ